MAEARIKTTVEFIPEDYDRLRRYADSEDVGLSTAIMRLLEGKRPRIPLEIPSVEDVVQHCQEKGYTFDPESFVAFYESKGWKIGNQPMKNWKAACMTWHKREVEKNGQSGHVTRSQPESGDDADRQALVQREAEREIAEIERNRKAHGL